MEVLKKFSPLFQLVIAISAVIAILVWCFQLALSPIQEQVSNHIPTKIDRLEKDLKDDIKRVEHKVDRLEDKVDRLIDHLIDKDK